MERRKRGEALGAGIAHGAEDRCWPASGCQSILLLTHRARTARAPPAILPVPGQAGSPDRVEFPEMAAGDTQMTSC